MLLKKKSTLLYTRGPKPLTFAAMRLWNALAKMASSNDYEGRFQVTVAELSKNLPGLNDRSRLIETLRLLRETSVEGYALTKEKDAWKAFGLLSEPEVNFKKWIIFYEYEEGMKKVLRSDGMKAKLSRLVNTAYRGTRYGWFLYELILEYQEDGATPFFDIPTLRKLLRVGDDKYPKFAQFSDRVLRSAVTKVKEQLGISLSLEYAQRGGGKAVTHVRINIDEWPAELGVDESSTLRPEPMTNKASLVKELKALGVDSKALSHALKSYGSEDFHASVEAFKQWVANKKQKRQRISNVSASFLASIHQKWRPNTMNYNEKKVGEASANSLKKKPVEKMDKRTKQSVVKKVLDGGKQENKATPITPVKEERKTLSFAEMMKRNPDFLPGFLKGKGTRAVGSNGC